MTIRVLVADDQSMVRAGFRMLLAGEEDIEVVAEASNGLEAVDKAARFHPAVVLMDIRMPELDGLQATRRILAADNGARVLVLTTFDLDEYVYDALGAGASGFLLKDVRAETLFDAVRVVAQGDALLAPAVTKRLVSEFARLRPSPPPRPQALDELTPVRPKCCASWRKVSRTARSRRGCSSARRRSRPTSRGCSASWSSPTGRRRRSWLTRPACWRAERDAVATVR